ncbi:MAG: hypothetical protein HKN94_03865 [Acidimicrobiales bacterium]|nr:hypothetical protein [Acidimicrobiales bacterium]RZV48263.1 MAG: hypothetical protein EX269_02400 [Acidimicrobiales bacterium]
MKTLDAKLAALKEQPGGNDFIICYAADPDMGGGLRPTIGAGTIPDRWRDEMAEITEKGDIDILLASVSTMDVLARERGVFLDSPVTPAIRANDTSDIWMVRGGTYSSHPSRPFATTTVKEAMYGTLHPDPDQAIDVPLGLWSITFNNDLEADERSLLRYRDFRAEAAAEGFRHFVEVFNPNVADPGIQGPVGDYVNDCIARMLAGVPRASRPEFLKVGYNGPQALEDLSAGLDVTVGVLGGPPSTSNDSFTFIRDVKKYGGRVALFGRRIKVSDSPIIFTELLRRVAESELNPEEATREYHGRLADAGITPSRSLEDDLVIETPELLL